MSKLKPFIRWMEPHDFETAAMIDSTAHPRMGADAWTAQKIEQFYTEQNQAIIVAEDETLLGFLAYRICHVKGWVQISKVVTDRPFRRKGVGRSLVNHLLDRTCSIPNVVHLAWVRESLLSAQLFFQKVGFHATDTQRGKYKDTGEDGYLFEHEVAYHTRRGKKNSVRDQCH